jgi:hypothetical protein
MCDDELYIVWDQLAALYLGVYYCGSWLERLGRNFKNNIRDFV